MLSRAGKLAVVAVAVAGVEVSLMELDGFLVWVAI